MTIQGAVISIPAFTKGKQLLSKWEVELSQQMACVHIHVELVIRVLKNRYKILQAWLPITLIKKKGDEGTATVDKLLTIGAVLTNVYIYRRTCCIICTCVPFMVDTANLFVGGKFLPPSPKGPQNLIDTFTTSTAKKID